MKFPPIKICLLCRAGEGGKFHVKNQFTWNFPPSKFAYYAGEGGNFMWNTSSHEISPHKNKPAMRGRGEILCEIPVHMKFPPIKICFLYGEGGNFMWNTSSHEISPHQNLPAMQGEGKGEISCEIPVHMKFPPLKFACYAGEGGNFSPGHCSP